MTKRTWTSKAAIFAPRILAEVGNQVDECLYLYYNACPPEQKHRLSITRNPIAMINLLVVSIELTTTQTRANTIRPRDFQILEVVAVEPEL